MIFFPAGSELSVENNTKVQKIYQEHRSEVSLFRNHSNLYESDQLLSFKAVFSIKYVLIYKYNVYKCLLRSLIFNKKNYFENNLTSKSKSKNVYNLIVNTNRSLY